MTEVLERVLYCIVIVDIIKNTQTTPRNSTLHLMLIVPHSSLVYLAVHGNLTKLQTHTNNRQTGSVPHFSILHSNTADQKAKHTEVNESVPRVYLFLLHF